MTPEGAGWGGAPPVTAANGRAVAGRGRRQRGPMGTRQTGRARPMGRRPRPRLEPAAGPRGGRGRGAGSGGAAGVSPGVGGRDTESFPSSHAGAAATRPPCSLCEALTAGSEGKAFSQERFSSLLWPRDPSPGRSGTSVPRGGSESP